VGSALLERRALKKRDSDIRCLRGSLKLQSEILEANEYMATSLYIKTCIYEHQFYEIFEQSIQVFQEESPRQKS
jgi:hypothetical protein